MLLSYPQCIVELYILKEEPALFRLLRQTQTMFFIIVTNSLRMLSFIKTVEPKMSHSLL